MSLLSSRCKAGAGTPARFLAARTLAFVAATLEVTALVRLVVIDPTELARLVAVLPSALPGAVRIVPTFLIGRVVVGAPPLIGIIGVDAALLDRGVHVVLSGHRAAQGCQHGGDGEREQLRACDCHIVHPC